MISECLCMPNKTAFPFLVLKKTINTSPIAPFFNWPEYCSDFIYPSKFVETWISLYIYICTYQIISQWFMPFLTFSTLQSMLIFDLRYWSQWIWFVVTYHQYKTFVNYGLDSMLKLVLLFNFESGPHHNNSCQKYIHNWFLKVNNYLAFSLVQSMVNFVTSRTPMT